MAPWESTNRPQGNPQRSGPVSFGDAPQGPQDATVNSIRRLEHSLNTLTLAPGPASRIGGTLDRRYDRVPSRLVGPTSPTHPGATQPEGGSIPSQSKAVDGIGSTIWDDANFDLVFDKDKTPTQSSVQPPQLLALPDADKRSWQGPPRNPSFPIRTQRVQPSSSHQPSYGASGSALWSLEVLQQRLSSISEARKVSLAPDTTWRVDPTSAGSAAYHHGQQSHSASRATHIRTTTFTDNSVPIHSRNEAQTTLAVPFATEPSVQFLQPDETSADNLSAHGHASAAHHLVSRRGSQPIDAGHAEPASFGSGVLDVTAGRCNQPSPAVASASASTPTIPSLVSEDKVNMHFMYYSVNLVFTYVRYTDMTFPGPAEKIDRDETPRPMDYSRHFAHLAGPPMSREPGALPSGGRLPEDPIPPGPWYRSTDMQTADSAGSITSSGRHTSSAHGGSDGAAHQPQQQIAPNPDDVRLLLDATRPVGEKKASEREDQWTPVTAKSRRSRRQRAPRVQETEDKDPPLWLQYYPPTLHKSGPKASRYTLGNVYIHVMKGERFTPASASKLITGHVTDKPRPCFLTWWGESPEDVIYLAPLPGAIPPVEWQEVGHNSNLHVLEHHTWRDRWCSVEWSPRMQTVMLKREGKRSRMTKVFAPPSPQHPNQRKSLRPKISIRWEDSPEEHPLKSSFIWAGDPGEAIDLTALDTLEKEEAVVAPFPQYCHLDLPELWKLHHWWRHMYAADPASIAPQAH